MKHGIRRLVLNRETIRVLQNDELARVAGGNPPWDNTGYQWFCVDLTVPECVLPPPPGAGAARMGVGAAGGLNKGFVAPGEGELW